jgi:lysozyme
MELQMKGIDVSQYQGTIDWGRVQEDDIDFAFIRSTICLSTYANNEYKDWRFEQNWQNARQDSTLALGVYHVFTPLVSVDTQLHAIDKSLQGKTLDFPIVIDIERTDVKDRTEHTRLMVNFLSALEQNFEKPIIYTGAWFWNVYVTVGDWSRYKLWTAAYTAQPIIPKGWTEWQFWQYSSSGTVSGIAGRCDMNIGKFEFDDFEEIDIETTDLVPVRNGLGIDSMLVDELEPGSRFTAKKMWVEVKPGQWCLLNGNFKAFSFE